MTQKSYTFFVIFSGLQGLQRKKMPQTDQEVNFRTP